MPQLGESDELPRASWSVLSLLRAASPNSCLCLSRLNHPLGCGCFGVDGDPDAKHK